ncbi:hypothetical protein C7974DRAFT_402425 [Boeremia exigua]|uniref:uncharacterized protein n=1 Tax=Boeremia exigua TaxID=749465 RepID=UPI001E8EA9F5|nr:uncharacterized protein C7974DRAFT_402425 [Boeremia exigua]KAH6616771.1 hypothetical protein C7974DRAFT_402425 [Boeremia exigua]
MQGDDEDFELDGVDSLGLPEDEENKHDSDDNDNTLASKKLKRKRAASDTGDGELNHSKHTDARIKAEGGEAFILEDGTSSLSNSKSSRVFGTFGRRDREKGESLPAYHKRVTAKLDDDDALMLEMREKGFSDRQIAEKLAKDGRVRYDQKSISTRIMRIRLAQAENVDYLLNEGLKEWEMEDDQRLAEAYALADIEISYEIERIRAWRFRKVSEYMRRLKKDSLFSANACRTRYGQLTSGTARIPCDVDDDPAARRTELELFRQFREAARDKEENEKETRESMEKRIKDQVKIKNAQKAEEVASKRAADEEKKAQNLMQRAAQAQLRFQKAAENRKAKSERNAQIKQAASTPKKNSKKPKPDTSLGSSKAPTPKTTPSKPGKEDSEAVDPRSYLNISDLTSLCAKRGLPTSNKSKKDLIASLVDADMEWSHDQLRKMCKAKGLSAGGNKTVMRYQLALKAAQSCPSFETGMKAVEEAEDEGGDAMVVDAE